MENRLQERIGKAADEGGLVQQSDPPDSISPRLALVPKALEKFNIILRLGNGLVRAKLSARIEYESNRYQGGFMLKITGRSCAVDNNLRKSYFRWVVLLLFFSFFLFLHLFSKVL